MRTRSTPDRNAARISWSAFAGMPPTKTCINCHSQIYSDSATLEPVRASYRDDRSIEWIRVADLPDFVYYDHSAHLNAKNAVYSPQSKIELGLKIPLPNLFVSFH